MRPPEETLFSIIIPVYNRPEEISDLLSSLEKQTDSGFETIIVEDGSTVDCLSAMREFQRKFPSEILPQRE